MTYDVLVIGGGPGGSTAAWQLARAGVRTSVIDAARFPRVKLCAGWVTPRVMEDLEIDPSTYPLTLQSFSRAILELDGETLETSWPKTVGYGIVRKEFDHFLLERARAAGARIQEEMRVAGVAHREDRVIVSTPAGDLAARIVIGAGGYHCPVSRAFGAVSRSEIVVVTRESETRLGRERLAEIAPRSGVPELFPEPDLQGYAWYFSKGDFLNIGIGTVGSGADLHARHRRFLDRLQRSGRLHPEMPLVPFRGHAYALRVTAPRRVAGPGFFLVGDAAGLARAVSGEGIGPAVASARLAASHALRALGGERDDDVAEAYRREITKPFGSGAPTWIRRWLESAPRSLLVRVGAGICRSAWLRRQLVFARAFGMG